MSERWDDRLAESDLRHRAAMEWGEDAQINKAAEEFAELAAALNRLQNNQQSFDELLDELVDARIMLWQLELLFGDEELADRLDELLDDLDARLGEVDDA